MVGLGNAKTESLVIVLGISVLKWAKATWLTGNFGLAKTTSDNGMRLLDFADA